MKGSVSGRIADITDPIEAKRSFLSTWQGLEQKKHEVLNLAFAMTDEQVEAAYRDLHTLAGNLDQIAEKIEELETS